MLHNAGDDSPAAPAAEPRQAPTQP
jgi:hypothetical protein